MKVSEVLQSACVFPHTHSKEGTVACSHNPRAWKGGWVEEVNSAD